MDRPYNADLIEIPPRVPEWEGLSDSANDITLLLTVTHPEGVRRGHIYQVCDVSQLLDLADVDNAKWFLFTCGLKMIEEVYVSILMNDPEWPPSEMVWEFSITRTAPNARGFGRVE